MEISKDSWAYELIQYNTVLVIEASFGEIAWLVGTLSPSLFGNLSSICLPHYLKPSLALSIYTNYEISTVLVSTPTLNSPSILPVSPDISAVEYSLTLCDCMML